MKLLEKAGFRKPSEIQKKVIPLVLQGKDVIGGSATGSGKTLAFGAGIIERIKKEKGLQVLILTPTRELAEQVGNAFTRFSEYKQLMVAIVYGGISINHQIRDLRNSEIVVGTPGRIIDHMERGTINFSDLKILVLDEADRMLDMGFVHDVEKIIKNCPKERQTLLFSATISGDVEHIASRHMKNPETISVEPYVDPAKLKQTYYDIPKNLKFSLLVHLLKKEKHGLVMVFCNTRHNTNFIGRNLRNLGMDVLAIHGGLTQQKRNRIMEKFNKNKVYVLVCTDIAARGLDIGGVSHIYNYDIPKTSKDYIHRIGRTARAGKEGIAINIISDRDYDNFSNVLKDSSLNIEKAETPEVEVVRMMLPNQDVQRRQRWDSRDWQSRRFNRERHARNRERSGEGKREERHERHGQENSMGGRKNFRNKSRGRNFGGRRRIPQRSRNYRSQGRRQGNRSMSFSRRGRF
ncbi:MAG TPA: DEAD/DEAH box helicase [Candidatus Pacearchaeota archaeon]|nr:DEAD/DEAH box helicase [Candidatus Pacearchaeota archaeon]